MRLFTNIANNIREGLALLKQRKMDTWSHFVFGCIISYLIIVLSVIVWSLAANSNPLVLLNNVWLVLIAFLLAIAMSLTSFARIADEHFTDECDEHDR